MIAWRAEKQEEGGYKRLINLSLFLLVGRSVGHRQRRGDDEWPSSAAFSWITLPQRNYARVCLRGWWCPQTSLCCIAATRRCTAAWCTRLIISIVATREREQSNIYRAPSAVLHCKVEPVRRVAGYWSTAVSVVEWLAAAATLLYCTFNWESLSDDTFLL